MTDFINTNRLRVSAFDAKRVAGFAHRSVRVQFHRYYSRDHGKRRLESNWAMEVCDWHFIVKWRPDGKRLTPTVTVAPEAK